MRSRLRPTIVLWTAFASLIASAGVEPEHPSEAEMDGARYVLIVSPEPRKLVSDFDESIREGAITAKMSAKIKRDTEFGFAIFLSGCREHERTGICDVTATLRVFLADGTPVLEQRDLTVWNAPAPEQLTLSKATWVTSSYHRDPPGRNTVRAEITDRVTGRTLVLERGFELAPLTSPTAR